MTPEPPTRDTEAEIREAIAGQQPFPELPTLSVRQPWAWAILHAGKDRENRSRKQTPGFGWHYLHASAGIGQRDAYDEARAIIDGMLHPEPQDVREFRRKEYRIMADAPRGAIVGAVLLAGWTDEDEGSAWFGGPYALRIIKTLAFPTPQPAKGRLGFWTWPNAPSVAQSHAQKS
jgi:hypothetical protein